MSVTPFTPAVLACAASTRPVPGGVAALRAGVHAQRLLLLKSLLARVDIRRGGLEPAVRQRFERDWRVLEWVERADRTAVRDVIDYPMTGAWLAQVLAAPEGPGLERDLAHLGGVAAAAAVRVGRRFDLTVSAPAFTLALPGLGVMHCPTGQARLRIGSRRVRITDGEGRGGVVLTRSRAMRRYESGSPMGGGPGWSGLRPLPGSTVMFDDLDPYRVSPHGVGPVARPALERPDSADGLWAERWRAATQLLWRTDSERADEVVAVLRVVVPITADDRSDHGEASSATLRSAPGAMLASLPTSAEEMAEILVHEAHHTKLAVIQEVVPLCRRVSGAIHSVGWRPDPRPVPAVLQGAYAHLALTDLWSRARDAAGAPEAWRQRAVERFERYRDHVGEALSILLESDELTLAGREFVREMEGHHVSLGTQTRIRG
ncbi:aKG-HExxH-type peptide beta-hydroxylase [Actinomycetota bacterium Odt1-20B]